MKGIARAINLAVGHPLKLGKRSVYAAITGGLVGATVFFLSQPLVKVTGVIFIGSISAPVLCEDVSCQAEPDLFIEDPSLLASVLRARYRTREAKLNRLQPPFVYQVHKGAEPQIINIELKALSIKQGSQYIQRIFDWISTRHDRLSTQRLQKIKDYQEAVEQIRSEIISMAASTNHWKDLDLSSLGIYDAKNENGKKTNVQELYLLQTILNPTNLIPAQVSPTELLSITSNDEDRSIARFLMFIFAGMVLGVTATISLMGTAQFLKEVKKELG